MSSFFLLSLVVGLWSQEGNSSYVGSSGQVVSGLWEVPQRKMNEAYVEGPTDYVFSYSVYVHPLAGNPVNDGVMSTTLRMYVTLRILVVSTSFGSREF